MVGPISLAHHGDQRGGSATSWPADGRQRGEGRRLGIAAALPWRRRPWRIHYVFSAVIREHQPDGAGTLRTGCVIHPRQRSFGASGRIVGTADRSRTLAFAEETPDASTAPRRRFRRMGPCVWLGRSSGFSPPCGCQPWTVVPSRVCLSTEKRMLIVSTDPPLYNRPRVRSAERPVSVCGRH